MNSTDIIIYPQNEIGFDNNLYIKLQTEAILERLSKFNNHPMYLEIGGKFLYDPHAARVLPGFDPSAKVNIIHNLGIPFEIFYCVNANDIKKDRQLSNQVTGYSDATIKMIHDYQTAFKTKISVIINLVSVDDNKHEAETYKQQITELGFDCYMRYSIQGYPNPDLVLHSKGFGKDDYIPHEAKLILVSGAASNSGKMSTCLGQMYHDHLRGIESGYAKYELFPIWNIPITHPVNLAYEAATVDIGDYNLIDPYHQREYGVEVVNYNRDVEAFPIISTLSKRIVKEDNFVRTYKSPTDMGISKAGFAIINDENVKKAATEEILRRKEWYAQLIPSGKASPDWVKKCETLYDLAIKNS